MNKDKKIVAVMDLGSQTFRLAAATCTREGAKVMCSILENVRLGEGLAATGTLKSSAVERGIKALERFKQELSELGGKGKYPVSLTATATAALRRASNASDFLDKAAMLGVEIEVISGEKEAAITAEGVLYTLQDEKKAGNIGIIDAGGGSTEISVYSKRGIIAWTSIEIGAVRLTEEYMGSQTSPPAQSAIEAMTERIDRELEEALESLLSDTQILYLAGSGGTVTTAAAMELGMESYDPARIRGFKLTASCLEKWIHLLAGMTKYEKDSICGLEPERSDIILSGIVIIHRALKKLGLPALIVSDGGLLLGLLISAIKKECTFHAEPSCSRGLYV